ncbi:heavy-metal-associated domain-containing protein [Nonomuraea turcica]|uniref:heavy-metal-associated domain-containing protein n=1 Tax=Nonomuraea sp. G32 TaxID=3067274 RepID=UPI00273CD6EF|nr:heavy-metal-associated domain-containing protein [Nonomuraea sp. G32]MDP4510023.1 heavy-metal-associated domain-containing protein [Nonomuraea sp. G32]
MARHRGPTCRVVLDLSGVTWGGDRNEATAQLLARPGVLEVKVDPHRHRAVVIHDAHYELPDLWNWLVQCANDGEQGRGHA